MKILDSRGKNELDADTKNRFELGKNLIVLGLHKGIQSGVAFNLNFRIIQGGSVTCTFISNVASWGKKITRLKRYRLYRIHEKFLFSGISRERLYQLE